jgi:hypothetical protein
LEVFSWKKKFSSKLSSQKTAYRYDAWSYVDDSMNYRDIRGLSEAHGDEDKCDAPKNFWEL